MENPGVQTNAPKAPVRKEKRSQNMYHVNQHPYQFVTTVLNLLRFLTKEAAVFSTSANVSLMKKFHTATDSYMQYFVIKHNLMLIYCFQVFVQAGEIPITIHLMASITVSSTTAHTSWSKR